MPTFYVVNPADESVVMRREDGMSVAETVAFLDEARVAAAGPAPSSPLEAALLKADRLNGEGRKAEAADCVSRGPRPGAGRLAALRPGGRGPCSSSTSR